MSGDLMTSDMMAPFHTSSTSNRNWATFDNILKGTVFKISALAGLAKKKREAEEFGKADAVFDFMVEISTKIDLMQMRILTEPSRRGFTPRRSESAVKRQRVTLSYDEIMRSNV
jgi:flagellar hook-basal body complex protein FliE